MRYVVRAICAFGLLAFGTMAFAHHGDAGRFEDELTTITGTVVALQLINPHSSILMSVTDESGNAVTWHVEMEAPQRLQSAFGWSRSTLTPGTRITVTGRRIKSRAPNINVTERARIVLTDSCKEIYHSRDLESLGDQSGSCS